MARKILLADDSVTAQNMGRKILADAGYEVVTVNNGSAALKKIAEIKPDLVILDVYMPGYSGLEVCQRLKENPDSSRMPVLLTVGKLEPFKPEEAQRVRAEAFIVKPFEASELLSTLSKLEDKVVPRSEPSKPGRFARAVASVEESGRGRIQPIDGGDESGWKSRISFPHEKTEPEAKAEDDSAIYNPMNRDLRTVIASPAERVEEKRAGAKKKEKEEEKPLPEMAVESSVDVAAVAPACVPQDVTPEEVAAISAAAAQIQALQIQLEEEKSLAERATAAEAHVTEIDAAAESKLEENSATAVTAVPAVAAVEVAETQDVPMTMAAAGGDTSRWTAVPVALDADEANISLEQEMQKVYSAFAADQLVADQEGTVDVRAEAALSEVSAASAAVPELATAVASSSQEVQPEAAALAAVESGQSESNSQPYQDPTVSFIPAEPVAIAETASAAPPAEPGYASVTAEAVASQFVEPATAAVPNPAIAESEPAMEGAQSEAAAVDDAASANRFTSFTSSGEQPPTQEQAREEAHEIEPAQEVESVKSTAAAWASWRQIRDASEPPPTEVPQQESSIPAAAAAVEVPAAMAVAAGAEKLIQEASQPTSENPADVASIVDSVLADLRPRLMAEISRKISEKK